MDIDSVVLDFDQSRLVTLNLALAVIMFGVALDLKPGDFVQLARDPRAPLIGLLCQFLILPAIAFGVGRLLAPTPSMALGLILISACPGGNVSNYFTWLGNGKVSVSVGMTAISTLAAMVVTPLNVTVWGSLADDTAAIVTELSIDPLAMVRNVALLLAIPAVLGMSVRHWRPAWADRLIRPIKTAGGLFFVIVVISAFSANSDVFVAAIGVVFLPVFVLNTLALGLGYGAATGAGLSVPERRAVAIEVGIQNSGLGLVLAFDFFDALGGMVAVAGWWSIWHLITGLTLGTGWALWDRRAAA